MVYQNLSVCLGDRWLGRLDWVGKVTSSSSHS